MNDRHVPERSSLRLLDRPGGHARKNTKVVHFDKNKLFKIDPNPINIELNPIKVDLSLINIDLNPVKNDQPFIDIGQNQIDRETS